MRLLRRAGKFILLFREKFPAQEHSGLIQLVKGANPSYAIKPDVRPGKTSRYLLQMDPSRRCRPVTIDDGGRLDDRAATSGAWRDLDLYPKPRESCLRAVSTPMADARTSRR